MPVTSWHSLDTTVVTTEDSGFIRTRAKGNARLVVSAGGVFSDTVTVVVRERPVNVVFREDWRRPITDQWIPFGDPTSAIVGGILRIQGDAHLTSGVLTSSAFDAHAGIGTQVRIRLPLSAPQWQSLSVVLGYVAPPDSIRNWKGRAEGLQPTTWVAEAAPRTCQFTAPRREGGEFMRFSSFYAAIRPVAMERLAPTVTDSAWHTVVVQLFGDGRCALAIDGKSSAVSNNALLLDRPLRMVIEGQSVGTNVEAGAVEVWTGIRTGIDWGALEPAPRTVRTAGGAPRRDR